MADTQQAHTGAPRKSRAPFHVKLRRRISATFWLSYIVLAASVGVFCGLVPSQVLRLVSHKLHVRVSHAVVAVWCTLCLLLPERVNGARVRITGQLPPKDCSVLVISNHKCDLDYFFVWAAAAKVGVLQPGHFNAVAKGVLRKLPLCGWMFKLVGFLFLARSWEADRDRIAAWCVAAARKKRPQWLVLYPEGTRFTPRAKERSDIAAKEHGQTPLQGELLLPRPKGFCELARALPSAGFTHVLDMTLCYIGSDNATPVTSNQLGTSALLGLAAGALPVARIDVHCSLHSLADVAGAASDDARRDWLMQRWRQKEKLLQHAVETGTLADGPHRPQDEAPVPAGRMACITAIATVAMAFFLRLLAHTAAFRMYVFVASIGCAALAYFDPPDW